MNIILISKTLKGIYYLELSKLLSCDYYNNRYIIYLYNDIR